jgi:hypothetical protein
MVKNGWRPGKKRKLINVLSGAEKMGQSVLKGYVVIYLGNKVITFVKQPRGYWIQTHPSVLFVKCKKCGSPRGVLCRSRSKRFTSSAHAVRRRSLKKNWTEMVNMVPGLAVSDALRKM